MARTTREPTDAQWAKLAPLLLPQRRQFGPWETVASRFRRWRRQGIWDRVLAALQADTDAPGELDWLLHRRAAPRGADAAQADGGRGGQADGSPIGSATTWSVRSTGSRAGVG